MWAEAENFHLIFNNIHKQKILTGNKAVADVTHFAFYIKLVSLFIFVGCENVLV